MLGFSTENACKIKPVSNNAHPMIERAGDSIVTTATRGLSLTSAQPLVMPIPMPVGVVVLPANLDVQGPVLS